jgi:hypothetical protein
MIEGNSWGSLCRSGGGIYSNGQIERDRIARAIAMYGNSVQDLAGDCFVMD